MTFPNLHEWGKRLNEFFSLPKKRTMEYCYSYIITAINNLAAAEAGYAS